MDLHILDPAVRLYFLSALETSSHSTCMVAENKYRIAGMFGRDKIWRIASSKVIDKKSLTNDYSSIAWFIIIIIMKWTDE